MSASERDLSVSDLLTKDLDKTAVYSSVVADLTSLENEYGADAHQRLIWRGRIRLSIAWLGMHAPESVEYEQVSWGSLKGRLKDVGV